MEKRESEGTVEEPLDLIKLSLDERMYLLLLFVNIIDVLIMQFSLTL